MAFQNSGKLMRRQNKRNKSNETSVLLLGQSEISKSNHKKSSNERLFILTDAYVLRPRDVLSPFQSAVNRCLSKQRIFLTVAGASL